MINLPVSAMSVHFGRRHGRRLVCLLLTALTLVPFFIAFTNKSFRARKFILHSSISKNDLACMQPKLKLWHDSVAKFFTTVSKLKCSDETNWAFVENGTFHISPGAIRKYGNITCDCTPIIRGDDDFKIHPGKQIVNMADNSPLQSDFLEVKCKSQNNKIYENLLSGISRKSVSKHVNDLHETSMGLNILMFGFDSVSRMTWMRNLIKTHDYFTKTLKGIVLEGYNIVGDGTPQALLPILTGQTEPELPEARRGKSGASTVDGHPWIWKDFKKVGYVTQYGEDGAGFGTFHYRMLGFKDQPVDHYLRPFYLKAESEYAKHKPYCLGSTPRHLNMLNWVKEFYNVYSDRRKFSFLFHSELTHGYTSELQKVDNDLSAFLEHMYKSNKLNNTVLILMADHGARFQSLRQTVQGKLEERMPYMAFRFSTWFEQKYLKAMNNLRTNVKRLTTPFDIHATFHDILEYTDESKGDLKYRGISLFQEIPKERSCQDAGIEAHWCACVKWEKVDPNQEDVQIVVKEFINKINKITSPHRDKCQVISVANVTSAVKFQPNSDVLKFKQSADFDGFKADMSDNMQASEILYQITVNTEPGNGLFEATIKYNVKDQKYMANDREISRINKYGKQPHCVMEQHPHLRPFCYCKNQIS